MRLLAALLALISAGGAALAQRGTIVLTKTEARAMTPEALSRRIFGGLAPLMLPVPDRGQPGVQPTRPLSRLFFYTLPSGASVAGMCRTELVAVEFAVAGRAAGADTPVRPRRISSEPGYFVRDPARLRAGDRNQDEAGDDRRIDAACAAIDPRSAHIVRSAGEHQLGVALRLLIDLAEAARAGRPLVPLDCSALMENDRRLSEAQCLSRVAQLGVDSVDWVSACEPPAPAVCHRLFVGGYQLDLVMTSNNQRLAEAKLDQLIVIADRLID